MPLSVVHGFPVSIHSLAHALRNGTLGESWGATAAERDARYPCDDVLAEPDQSLWRAVRVDAPAPLVWRWVCQLRVAPYSYDWIDNRGRRSPRELIDGLDDVRVGQRVMTMFEIVHVAPGESLTISCGHTVFGDELAGTYRVVPLDDDRSRIVVKLLARYPGGIHGALLRATLPIGDLVMMRKQLLTLKALAERDARR